MCNNYMYNDYLAQQQFYNEWYNEWYAREYLYQQERLYTEKEFPYISEDANGLKMSYCFNCEKNCVVQLDGYTQCMGCKDILCTDVKQIRKIYSTKSIQNKITHFTNALNEYLKDTKFYRRGAELHEVQQIVDVFKELIEFMRASKKVG